MNGFVTGASIETCRARDIHIDAEAQFGFERPKEILLESPCSVRRGIYDIDYLGAYSYLGGRETLIRHVATIGRFCSIASNIVAGQVEHPVDLLSTSGVLTRSSENWGGGDCPVPVTQRGDDSAGDRESDAIAGAQDWQDPDR